MLIIGIDPGISGSICFLIDGKIIDVVEMPIMTDGKKNNNPPKFEVEFFKEQKNLDKITCYSNEQNKWYKSNTNYSNQVLTIKFRGSFEPRRGRINCSLNDNGIWRWFGVQFPIKRN